MSEDEKKWTCKYCQEIFDTFQQLGTHSKSCEARNKAKEHTPPTEPVPTPPVSVAPEIKPPKEDTVYRDESEPNAILRKIIEQHPGLTPQHVTEVMSWSELRDVMDPPFVEWVLSNMKGVSKQQASLISQKYSLALQRGQQSGSVQVPFSLFNQPQQQQGYGQPPPQKMPYPPRDPRYQPQQPQGYEYPPQPGMVSREELHRMLQEQETRQKTTTLESKLHGLEAKLAENMGKMKEDLLGAIAGAQPTITEAVPIDKHGNVVDIENAYTFKQVSKPANTQDGMQMVGMIKALADLVKPAPAPPKDDFWEQAKKMKEAGIPVFGSQQNVQDNPVYLELKNTLTQYQTSLDKMRDQMNINEQNHLQGRIEELNSRLANMAHGEWKSDEMKVIATTIQKFGEIIEEKKPMEQVAKILAPPGVTIDDPPKTEVPVEAAADLGDLKKAGLVRRVVTTKEDIEPKDEQDTEHETETEAESGAEE